MSHNATNWAWNIKGLTPLNKLVLMAICDCHNEATGRCDPSYDFIADKATVSRISAIRAVKCLTEDGYISLLSSKLENGQQRTNSYVIHLAKSEYQISNEAEYHSQSRVSNIAKPSITDDTRNEPEEPELKNKQKENPLFDQFWTSYPNKKGKFDASKKFDKLSPQDQQAILASMPAFLQSIADTRKTFASYSPPNPSTYINQRRFDDFASSPVDWEKIMRAARRLGWDFKAWGPAPFTAGCRAPAELLTPADNREWKQWMVAA